MDFKMPAGVEELRQRIRRYIEREVIPHERDESDRGGLPADTLAALQARTREAGLWAPQLPREHGGLGLEGVALCLVFEEAGRSTLGPIALHCAAPDEGNMHLLLRAATPAQRERYFVPLSQGRIRSCFAMTEPAPGAGSDPTQMRTRAEKRGSSWVINGHKWFTSGAQGAAFAIVAAVTDPQVPAKQGVTLFLVDTSTPGYELVRAIPTLSGGGQGGHCEVKLTDCVVPEEQVFGQVGQGFKLMQVRLGPARLTHCMRWLGAAARSLEIARDYAQNRTAFGKLLREHQAVQWMVADSVMDLHASRLMVLEAAWKLEQGQEARVETSLCKAFVAEAVGRVIDRSIQICGAMGISQDLILERFYREVRAFRIYDGPSEVHRMVIAREYLRGSLLS